MDDAVLDSLLDPKNIAQLWTGKTRHFRAVRVFYQLDNDYRSIRDQLRGQPYEVKRSSLKALHRKHAPRLAQLCRENGATWVKFAQVLSARPDLLPHEYIEALTPLQNEAKPVAFSKLIPTIETELGPQWLELVADIEQSPIATASIGQVHKIRLRDGREVALKVQLPQVKRLFKQDFVMFRLLANTFASRFKQLDLIQVIDELLKLTAQELDFTREAANIRAFEKLPHPARIKTPTLIPEMCSARTLCTEWIPGERLTDFLSAHPDEATDVLNIMMESYMQQIVQFGVYHADPHPGNFIINEQRDVYILDFGAMATLSNEERQHYSALLMAILSGQTDDLGRLLKEAGFSGADPELLDGLGASLKRSGRGGGRPSLQMSKRMQELMEKLRENRIVIPDSFVPLSRVLITLSGFMQSYGVKFRWFSGKS